MEPQIPAPTPEGSLIRTAREAAGMTAAQAAKASQGAVSATYWRDVERGYGGRRGVRAPAKASARLLATMARVTGVSPEGLDEAQREDAARVLREILRREEAPGPPPPAVRQDFPRSPSERALALFDGDVTKALIWEAGELEGGAEGDELAADLMRVLNRWRSGRNSRAEGTA